jgi:hypothetical protein
MNNINTVNRLKKLLSLLPAEYADCTLELEDTCNPWNCLIRQSPDKLCSADWQVRSLRGVQSPRVMNWQEYELYKASSKRMAVSDLEFLQSGGLGQAFPGVGVTSILLQKENPVLWTSPLGPKGYRSTANRVVLDLGDFKGVSLIAAFSDGLPELWYLQLSPTGAVISSHKILPYRPADEKGIAFLNPPSDIFDLSFDNQIAVEANWRRRMLRVRMDIAGIPSA